MHFFDYIFFRIYLYYSKFEGEIPITTGIYFVVLLQLFLTLFLVILINIFTGGALSKEYIDKDLYWTGYACIGISFLLTAILRYGSNSKVKKLVMKFGQYKANEFIKTWQIFSLPFLVLLFSAFIIIMFAKIK